MKKCFAAAAALGMVGGCASPNADKNPAPSNALCTGRVYNLTYTEAANYVDSRGMNAKVEFYIVGPEAGGDPKKVTTGHTFARASVWGRTITGVFDNAAKTACEVTPATYNKYKPAPAPRP